MQKEEFIELTKKIIEGEATQEDLSSYCAYFNQYQVEYPEWSKLDDETQYLIGATLHNRITATIRPAKSGIINLWYKLAIVASLLLICSFGYLFYRNSQPVKRLTAVDFAPGGNKAYLTLSNGTRISLTDASKGNVAQQAGRAIKKTADGELDYTTGSEESVADQSAFNTITTPSGGTWKVRLPDGTFVWLNASSSLTYPVSFASANEREVKLTGEAYFEVAHDKAKPFRVLSNLQLVEVLGTHFNINTYSDEPTHTTTLLKGAVKVSEGAQSVVLQPGQQASLTNSGQLEKPLVSVVDTDRVVAWKNGEFNFYKTDVQSVMRQISRWYDVEVEYSGKIPGDRITGTFPRNINASKALEILKLININYKIEGRKIIVK